LLTGSSTEEPEVTRARLRNGPAFVVAHSRVMKYRLPIRNDRPTARTEASVLWSPRQLRVVLTVTMLGLCWLCLVHGVAALCQFPSYLQTNITREGVTSLVVAAPRRRTAAAAEDDVGQDDRERHRSWRSGVRDQANSWTTTLTFDGALMTVERQTTASLADNDDHDVITARSFQCKCLDEIDGDRYLIQHQFLKSPPPLHENVRSAGKHDELAAEPINFACVQFVRRSAAVVQLRISTTTSKHYNQTLCDDARLRLEKWLIVDMATLFRRHSAPDETGSSERCPLVGGFSVRVFETGSRVDQYVCAGHRRIGDTRIEAECVPGDGQYFYFRSAACVPPGAYMYVTQKTICRASWSDDVYTYVVLTHNRLPYVWLFRFPAVLVADSFSAHLLRDLAADDSPHTTWSGGQHWRLDMVRDVQRPVTSLCIDDVDMCRSWTPQAACSSAPSTALSCPRTCGVCNESRPVVCTFHAELVGDWIAVTDPGQTSPAAPAVIIGASTMTVADPGAGVTEKFHCVTWSGKRRRQSGEEMIVTEHFDGCRPRYTCIRYQRRAAALLQLKLSQSRMWPLVDAVDQPVDCRAFSYDDDDDDRSARPFRGRRFRLLYSRQPRPPTACRLSLPHSGRSLRNYTMTYRNGTRCTDTSVTETSDGLGLLFSVGDCGPGVTPGTRTTRFYCIMSTSTSNADGVALVTRAASPTTDVRCWFYTAAAAQPEPEMYWLATADCGAAVKRLESAGDRLRHIAVLAPARKEDDVTSTWRPQRHLPADRRRNDDEADIDIANISDASQPTSDYADPNASSTAETETDRAEEPANVFVVFAAMVIFTLLQIPCNICRVSA